MRKIGLLSDTHGDLPPGLNEFFESCDEIWHAGDIGSTEVIRQLSATKPFKAVYGNIDSTEIRKSFPEYQSFLIENVKVLIIHIGGYPGHYHPGVIALIKKEQPNLFISGHSHILKVMYDKKHGLLHINPGAAGNNGWHKVITLVRFAIDKDQIIDLEIKEITRRGLIRMF